jgi:hypothetical protein
VNLAVPTGFEFAKTVELQQIIFFCHTVFAGIAEAKLETETCYLCRKLGDKSIAVLSSRGYVPLCKVCGDHGFHICPRCDIIRKKLFISYGRCWECRNEDD